MAKNYYKDATEIEGGKILLYHRADSPSSKWQARILKPDNKGEYVFRSTRKDDLEEAIVFAKELYDEMRFRQKHDIPLTSKDFEKAYVDWLEARKGYMTNERYDWHLGVATRYFFKYFKNKELAVLNEPDLEAYWEWRTREENILRTKPSASTLYMERDSLNQFFKWAERNNLMRRKPQIEMPVKLDRAKNRRPAFDSEDWAKLHKGMRSWVRANEHPQTVYTRETVRHYIMFMKHSGLRPREAKLLLWKHISFFESDE
jgi:integrase